LSSPRLSVLLPLADHRGLALASARAWAAQTLAPERYEVIAVADGREPRTAERVRRALRPTDRLLTLPDRGEIELYQAGAEAATGPTLLFTESHCVPDPDAASALVHFLGATGTPAATLASGHLIRGGLAPLEARLDVRGRAERPPERWWAGVSLRGFAIRRDLFREIGGFRTELERFAETALAIELDRRGLRAAHVEDAVVNHGDCMWPGDLEAALLSLGRGRRACLDLDTSGAYAPYLGGRGCSGPSELDPRLARALCRTLLRGLGDVASACGRARARSSAGALCRFLPVAVAGARGAWLAWRAGARLAFLSCMPGLGDPERRMRRFCRAWHAVVRCGEIETTGSRPPAPLGPPPDPLCYRPGEMAEGHFLGFHGSERDAEGSFRWSSPAAVMRFAAPPADYRAVLHLMRPPAETHLRLVLNGHPLDTRADGPGSLVTFSADRRWLRGDGEQHLVVLCAPFRPRDHGLADDRVLGVALRALAFE
jgi:hypothetical protein